MTTSTPRGGPAVLPNERLEFPSSVDIVCRGSRWMVSGELDAYSAPGFVAGFTRHLDERESSDVRIDCSALGFVDAGGLSALVLVARHARAGGRRFQISPTGSSLGRLLQLCGITDI